MRAHFQPLLVPLVLSFALVPATLVWAQPETQTPAAAEPPARDVRVERITHEDALSRIDELRVSGQTRAIEVQPRAGRAYQIAPVQIGDQPGDSQGSTPGNGGRSSWRILNF